MPRGNGTGPRSNGPRTGRGLGSYPGTGGKGQVGTGQGGGKGQGGGRKGK